MRTNVWGAMQAIPLTPGHSVVDLSFRPLAVWWGAALTLLGLLAAAILGRRN